MRCRVLKNLFLVLAVLFAATALAQTSSSKRSANRASKQQEPKVSTEFGLGIGARYNWFHVQPLSNDFTPNISMKMSYGAALQFRVNIGRVFGIQPEISYAYSTLRIADKSNSFSTKAKANLVQIPLLLSCRFGAFAINGGPVFTLMDNPTYTLTNPDTQAVTQMVLGRLTPTVTYTVGVSVKFAKCMILDVRYADQFRNIKSENAYVWTLDAAKQPEAQRFRTSSRSVQVRIGYAF